MPIYAWIAVAVGLVVMAAMTKVLTSKSEAPASAATAVALDGKTAKLHGLRYLEYRVGISINAAPAEVWKLLTNAGEFPQWNSTVVSIGGNIAHGETIKLVAKVAPERTFALRVSDFQPHTRMVWQDGNRIFKGVRTFKLTARPDGQTDFTMAEVLTGAMLESIAPKLPDFGPAFAAFAADLKRAAE